jgi:hypothetical protein
MLLNSSFVNFKPVFNAHEDWRSSLASNYEL